VTIADLLYVILPIASGSLIYQWGYSNGRSHAGDVRRDLDAMRERFDKQRALRPPTGTHYVDTTIREDPPTKRAVTPRPGSVDKGAS
jgi:hypothetical protein